MDTDTRTQLEVSREASFAEFLTIRKVDQTERKIAPHFPTEWYLATCQRRVWADTITQIEGPAYEANFT